MRIKLDNNYLVLNVSINPEGSPEESGSTAVAEEEQNSLQAILINDEEHSYEYVVEMLGAVAQLGRSQAFKCAVEVDLAGRTAIKSGSREECEKIVLGVKSYGADHRMLNSRSSMHAVVE
jgi:ATP-dependent Clp protease adaptor protein ClpS